MQNEITHWKRNVAIFLIGQCITLFGSMLVHYAVQWHITLTSQSGIAMMLLSISVAVPMFLASPFGGVWADRYNKKLLINLADASIAVVTLIMAVIFSLGFEYIALLMVCAAARGFGQGVQTPAVNSLIPEIVPAESLIRINGINSSIQSAVMFLSPVAGGALIAFMPVQTVLYIDVITAAIGISLLQFFVKTPPRKKKQEEKPVWRDMSEGLHYIKTHAFVKRLMVMSMVFNLLLAPAAFLTPLQTVRNFGEEPWRLVAIELAFVIGMALGGAIIAAWGGFKNKSYTLTLGSALSGICLVGLGLFESFVLYLISMGLIGLFWTGFGAPLMTMIQVQVDAEYMGRVLSVLVMVGSIMMPIGMVMWGPLADLVRIDWLMIISGGGLLIGSAVFISDKTLREAGVF
jgi:DHA3 family macrolide efflux protein-like MFS transporter